LDYERLLLDHLGLVDQVVRSIAHRHRLSADEADELRGAVRLKLVENDYAVLRCFEERCSLKTYLTSVIQRFFLDQRIARWGKWRPSLHARRLGPTAMLLERLLTRDHMSFDEAVELMRTNHGVEESPEALYEMSLGFPERSPRRFVGDDTLETRASDAVPPDEQLRRAQRAARAVKVTRALQNALAGLEAPDRLILKLRFRDGFQVAHIARLLALEQKPLYRRLEHVMKVLRPALEAQGIGPDDMEDD
jgi:RNA polymerase sigma factor (sigma-70 family)